MILNIYHGTTVVRSNKKGVTSACLCNNTSVDWSNHTLYDSGDANAQPHNHGNTGSSNHMPLYYVVYMWRRTA